MLQANIPPPQTLTANATQGVIKTNSVDADDFIALATVQVATAAAVEPT